MRRHVFIQATILFGLSNLGLAQPRPLPSFGLTPLSQSPGLAATYAVVADFTGDGNPDIAAAYGTRIDYGIAVVPGDGNGNVLSEIRSRTTSVVGAMVAADVNNDRKPDLIGWLPISAGLSPAGDLSILLGNGNGSFSQGTIYRTSLVSATFPGVVSDLNGDGNIDIGLVNQLANRVDVMMGNGNGTFKQAVGYATGQSYFSYVFVQDVDGDATIDLIAVNRFVGNSSRDIAVLHGRGDGTFDEPIDALRLAPTNLTPYLVMFTSADFNNDGRTDLAVLTDIGIKTYSLGGDGNFALSSNIPPPQSFRFGGGSFIPSALTVADMSGDGTEDLLAAFTDLHGDAISVFPGLGDGTFEAERVYFLSANVVSNTGAFSIAVGDLNRDGRVDVLFPQAPEALGIWMGSDAASLRTRITHAGDFFINQNDAAFTVEVTNDVAARSTTGRVSVRSLQGLYRLEAALSGAGWTCSENECWRDDPLPAGSSYPPITITLTIPLSFGGLLLERLVIVSGGESATTAAEDSARVLSYQPYCFFQLDAPRRVLVGVDGGDVLYRVGVTTYGCPYSDRSNDAWIRADGGASVARNTTGAPRTGSINFASPTGWKDSIIIEQAASPGCVFQLWPTSNTVGPNGTLAGETRVLTSISCQWTAASNASWITMSGNTSGTGLTPGVFFVVAPNLTGSARSGTISVSGQLFTVFQRASSTEPLLGSLPHWAVGGGWESSIELLNTNDVPAEATVRFYDGTGKQSALPLSSPDDPRPVDSLSFTAPSGFPLTRVMSPLSTFRVDSQAIGAVRPTVGAAQLTGDAGVDAFIRFRYLPTMQEAVVPLETRKTASYVLAFDNTERFLTGIAIANGEAAPAIIRVNVRDDSGAAIQTNTISLPSLGHFSFVVSDLFADAANKRGTVECETPAGGRISVSGLRFSPRRTFTTIPVLTNLEPGTGLISQLASGGPWTTTFTLVNSSGTPANARLDFFNDLGAPLILPLVFPQGILSSARMSSVQLTLAPHSTAIINSSDIGTEATAAGWARLTGNVGIGGFVNLHSSADQDAAVPLQATGANSYVFSFDNTGGRQTGIAVANGQAQAESISFVVRDQNGVQLESLAMELQSNGHASFMLPGRFSASMNRRGTIEVSASRGKTIGVTGLSFAPSGAFTTIPSVPKR